MEHQVFNSIGGEPYNAYLYKNYVWKNHFHRRAEFTFVTKGLIKAEIDGKLFDVKAGDALLVMPFSFHSLTPIEDTEFLTVVFDESYVRSFFSATSSLIPLSPVFTLDGLNAQMVYQCLGGNGEAAKNCTDNVFRIAVPNDDFLQIKAGLYTFCYVAFSSLSWVKRSRDVKLTFKIITFISENFASDITLDSMSKDLGYDYGYLSRIFNSLFNVNFRTLLNQFRCDHAYDLITNSDASITDVAMQSGFQSIRSFNRVFKEIIGCTPSELKASK